MYSNGWCWRFRRVDAVPASRLDSEVRCGEQRISLVHIARVRIGVNQLTVFTQGKNVFKVINYLVNYNY